MWCRQGASAGPTGSGPPDRDGGVGAAHQRLRPAGGHACSDERRHREPPAAPGEACGGLYGARLGGGLQAARPRGTSASERKLHASMQLSLSLCLSLSLLTQVLEQLVVQRVWRHAVFDNLRAYKRDI